FPNSTQRDTLLEQINQRYGLNETFCMEVSTDTVTQILSSVEILKDLEPEAIREIANQMGAAEFGPSDTIVKHGQKGDRLYIIADGQVEVNLPIKLGYPAQKVTLNKGAVVGEISMLTEKPYSASIVALNNVSTLFLQRHQFVALIEKHKSFARAMSSLMTERIARNGEIDRVGKYEIVGKLGRGAMATVYAARDKELEREVAIKMLKYELAYDASFLERFEREAKIIASLQHPNIVNVIDIINEYSTSFIVMEKMSGQNMEKLIRKQGAFPVPQARKILLQVASALQYAHSQGEAGIIHRDIKPSNIMVDEYGNVKLADFGLSGPPEESSLSMEGTPYYLAPEIIGGEKVDGRADIYAMGVMAFYMLTKTMPFEGSSVEETLSKQMNYQPVDIKSLIPDMDDGLAEFISGAMVKSADQRISDWTRIIDLLTSGFEKSEPSLHLDEVEISVRIEDVSDHQIANAVRAIKMGMQKLSIDHSIKVSHGSVELKKHSKNRSLDFEV
ncbi:MAG: protein kinase, partial [Pseudomonadota bacterium]